MFSKKKKKRERRFHCCGNLSETKLTSCNVPGREPAKSLRVHSNGTCIVRRHLGIGMGFECLTKFKLITIYNYIVLCLSRNKLHRITFQEPQYKGLGICALAHSETQIFVFSDEEEMLHGAVTPRLSRNQILMQSMHQRDRAVRCCHSFLAFNTSEWARLWSFSRLQPHIEISKLILHVEFIPLEWPLWNLKSSYSAIFAVKTLSPGNLQKENREKETRHEIVKQPETIFSFTPVSAQFYPRPPVRSFSFDSNTKHLLSEKRLLISEVRWAGTELEWKLQIFKRVKELTRSREEQSDRNRHFWWQTETAW